MLALYITICILWGFYCGFKNWNLYKSSFAKLFLGFVINTLICPVSLLFAIVLEARIK